MSGGGSNILVESFLSPFSIIGSFLIRKVVIFLGVVALGASIVVVMIMRVIDLIIFFQFNFFQMLIK